MDPNLVRGVAGFSKAQLPLTAHWGSSAYSTQGQPASDSQPQVTWEQQWAALGTSPALGLNSSLLSHIKAPRALCHRSFLCALGTSLKHWKLFKVLSWSQAPKLVLCGIQTSSEFCCRSSHDCLVQRAACSSAHAPCLNQGQTITCQCFMKGTWLFPALLC